jgi:hypothetical protein
MSSWLSEREQRLVAGAEAASAATPIPTQIVSNGEYLPPPQSETQKRVERRILELATIDACWMLHAERYTSVHRSTLSCKSNHCLEFYPHFV